MRLISLISVADPVLTGLFIVISPELFSRLILGAELSAAGQALGRIGGISMFALGLAAWPAAATPGVVTAASRALLIYNLIAAAYLGYVGSAEKMAGVLLWPAVAFHGGLAIVLAYGWLARKTR